MHLHQYWSQGEHATKKDGIISFKLMTDTHILNTIKCFEDEYDTTPLEDELKSRDLIRNKK